MVGLFVIGSVRLAINHTSFADLLVGPLILADGTQPADAIVVAGAGVIGQCEPNQNGVQRVLLAARLFRERRSPRVVFTGGTGQPCPVAEAMARLARDVGIPASAIWMETGSRSTRENAELAAPLLRYLGVRRALVVTDRLHARRAAGVLQHVGFDVELVTVPVYAGHPDNVSMLLAGLREYAALAYYHSRGWLGPGPPSESGNVSPETTALPTRVSNPAGPIAILGASYAAGWNLGPLSGAPVVNLGVTGQQSFELLERFERDVVPLRPRAVILWGYINDVFRATPGDEVAMARVRDSYRRMAALARHHGIAPVVATEVTVRSPSGWRSTMMSWIAPLLRRESYQHRVNRDIINLNRWLVELAREEGLLLLDLQSTLAATGGVRRPEYTLDDGSHITPAGYAALTTYARPILEDHLVVSHIDY